MLVYGGFGIGLVGLRVGLGLVLAKKLEKFRASLVRVWGWLWGWVSGKFRVGLVWV